MKKKLLSLIFVSALVVSLTACGGNGNSQADANADAASNAGNVSAEEETPAPDESESSGGYVQGVTDTEVIVANTAATSGTYASIGVPFTAGMQAYFDMVNDEGGIDGRTITFLHTDDEFDPVKGKAYLQEMVEDEKVFAIVGHFGTPVVSATVDDLKEYGIPTVYFATGIGELYATGATTNEEGYNLFPVQPIYTTEGQLMVARAVGTFGAKKIGIIYTSDDAGENMLQGAQAECDEIGVELVAEQVAAGADDVSAAVTSIKNAGVDFIIVGSIQGTFPTIVKEIAAQGLNTDCITSYVNVTVPVAETIAADVSDSFNIYGNNWVDYEGERAANLEQYQKWVDAEYADNPNGHAGWIAAHFFVEGLRRLEGKEVTWESYMAALEEAPIQNPFGGQIDYANGTRMGTQEMNLNQCVIKDGTPTWEVIDDLKSMDALLNQ